MSPSPGICKPFIVLQFQLEIILLRPGPHPPLSSLAASRRLSSTRWAELGKYRVSAICERKRMLWEILSAFMKLVSLLLGCS